MRKVEAIIRSNMLEKVKEELGKAGIKGMTITDVLGCGLQHGRREVYRGTEYFIKLLPKTKIEIVVSNNLAEQVIDIISQTAKSGEVGDGKIFVYQVEDAVRIRTGERGEKAI